MNLKFSLASNLIDRGFICQLSHELISLNVNILLSWRCFRRFDITSEKFFCRLRALLLKTLRIIFALICLKQLIRVCSRRYDHCSIGASSENSLIVHDVLRIILISVGSTIWILILLFLSNYARMRGKTLSTRSFS